MKDFVRKGKSTRQKGGRGGFDIPNIAPRGTNIKSPKTRVPKTRLPKSFRKKR